MIIALKLTIWHHIFLLWQKGKDFKHQHALGFDLYVSDLRVGKVV